MLRTEIEFSPFPILSTNEPALSATLRCSGGAFAFDDDGRHRLRTFGNHMCRDEDVLRMSNDETGHVLVTNRHLRQNAKPLVHNVVAWKNLRECECTIGADRCFESGGKLSPSRFPQ